MGRILTSTPKPHRTAALISTSSSSTVTKARHGAINKASYKSFYNIQKTRLSARYPFLPSKQIDRRVKQLWDNASAEKRANFCSTLQGTTPAKSPFKGMILKGLLKKLGPSDVHPTVTRTKQSRAGIQTGDPFLSSPHGTKPVPASAKHGILRSKEKKRQSTSRVSFRLDGTALPSPIPISRDHPTSLYKNEGLHVGTAMADRLPSSTYGKDERLKVNQMDVGYTDQKVIDYGKSLADKFEEVCEDAEGTSSPDVEEVNQHTDRGKKKMRQKTGIGGFPAALKEGTDASTAISNKLESEKGDIKDVRDKEQVMGTPLRRSSRAAALAANVKLSSPISGRNRNNADATNEKKATGEQGVMEASCPGKDVCLFRLKKTELSQEEKMLYEFEDTDSKASRKISKESTVEIHINTKKNKAIPAQMVTRPRVISAGFKKEESRNPEEYNLDSDINSKMFGSESRSPLMSHDVKNHYAKESKRGRPKKNSDGEKSAPLAGHSKDQSGGVPPAKKRGRPKKVISDVKQSGETGEGLVPKQKRGRPKKLPRLKQKCLEEFVVKQDKRVTGSQPKPKASLDTNVMEVDPEDSFPNEHVPWMVSASPPSSSEEAYNSESSSPYLFSQQSCDDILSSNQKVCESFKTFCQTFLSPKKTIVPGIEPSPSIQDSDVTSSQFSYMAEVMSISTEYSASQDSAETKPAPLKDVETNPAVPGESSKMKIRSQRGDGVIADRKKLSRDNVDEKKNVRGQKLKGTSQTMGGVNIGKRGSTKKQMNQKEPREDRDIQKTFKGNRDVNGISAVAMNEEGEMGHVNRLTRKMRMRLAQEATDAESTEDDEVGRGYPSNHKMNQRDVKPREMVTQVVQRNGNRAPLVEKNDNGGYSNQPKGFGFEDDNGSGAKGPMKPVMGGREHADKKKKYLMQTTDWENHTDIVDANHGVVSDNDSVRAVSGDSPTGTQSDIASSVSSEDCQPATSDGFLCDMFQPCIPSSQKIRRLMIPPKSIPPKTANQGSSHLFVEEDIFF